MEKEPTMEHNIEIKDAAIVDAEGLARVQKETWLNTYPNDSYGVTKETIQKKEFEGEKRIESWRKIIAELSTESRILVAKDSENTIVGFCSLDKGSDRNELAAIYVLPEFQGKGIGKKFIDEAFSWLGNAKDIFLHVVAYNEKSIEFYKKVGFEITNAKVDPYQLPDGVTMPLIEMVKKA